MVEENDVTASMFQAYSVLHIPRLIFRALTGEPDVVPLKLIIVGKQGTGKTAFAYYSTKVALALLRCHERHILGDKARCFNYLRERYGLCLGRECPPDKLDEELREGMYVTIDDLQKRFPRDVEQGIIRNRKVLFFDDAVMPGTYWLLGKEWRATHFAFREFERFFRDFAKILIITAPTLHHIDRVYKSNAVTIISDVILRKEDKKFWNIYTKVVLKRVVTPNGIKTVLKPEYIDMVRHIAAYGMPRWLEEELKERRYAIVKAASTRLRKLLESSGNE